MGLQQAVRTDGSSEGGPVGRTRMVNMWQMILSSLQHKINRQSFNTWLKPTRQLSFADGMLNVEVPSLLFADWISRNYLPLIEESAKELQGGSLQFRFTSRQLASVGGPPAGSEPLSAARGGDPNGSSRSENGRGRTVSPGAAAVLSSVRGGA